MGKLIANIIYTIGTIITILLVIISLLHIDYIYNPDAMLPFTISEAAFNLLAVGVVPMLGACIAVYHWNNIRKTNHPIINGCLLFLPGIVCSFAVLYWLWILTFGSIIYQIQSSILH